MALIGQAEAEVQVAMSSNGFREELGRLMSMDFDPSFGYRYVLWFDYTKNLMKELRVGDLLAVPNFSSSPVERRLSLLSITGIMPFHYASGNDLSGYTLFLEKTREEAFSDFDKQTDKSTEETTKIQVNAAPTGLELKGSSKVQVIEESQIPMFGGVTSILGLDLVGSVYNRGLENAKTISLGKLTKGGVDIRLKTDDLIRTHMAVFGYTGTGKSNLISTLIERLVGQDNMPVSVVVFDLMGEYPALVTDVLLQTDGFIGYLEATGLSDNVKKYMSGRGGLDAAALDIVKSFQIPATLREPKIFLDYLAKVKQLLKAGKIRVLYEDIASLEKLLANNRPRITGRIAGETTAEMGKLFGMARSIGKVSPVNVKKLIDTIKQDQKAPDLKEGTKTLLGGWLDALTPYAESEPFEPSREFRFERESDLVDKLLDKSSKKSSLYVLLSEHTDLERKFAYDVVASEEHSVYSERRRRAINSPLALFVFDEADEYIPQESSKGSGSSQSYDMSSQAVETLARRGRKFGLGVLIATQRVTYLNTNIVSQPHTYFISKLPRASDRQRVTEAFGIPEDMLRETFKFRRGDWLVISHEATGLTGVPIPIHADNAEDRIRSNVSKS